MKLLRILLTVLLLVGAWLIEQHYSLPLWQMLLVYLVPYLLIGYDVLWEAVEGIMDGDPFDECFLMSLATIGALFIGFLPGGEPQLPEAVFVMLFFQVGELFEYYAEHRSRKSISKMMDIRPDVAFVERGGDVVEVHPDVLRVGETIVVRPGEKVPVDGRVLDGTSSLNTVALTGESLPRDVAPGDDVISGCVNLSGVLRVRVGKSYGESTASKIIALVENSTENKSKSESFIRRFALRCHSGPCARLCSPVFLSELRRCVFHLALSCVDLPRRELSLCPGRLRSVVVLRWHWWCKSQGHPHQGWQLYGCFGPY